MRVTIHKTTKEEEAKLILYKGKYFIHVIVFDKTQGHYQVINKIKKHFTVNDDTCQAGWIINGRQEFFSKEMVNERIKIANKNKVKIKW